MKPKPAAKKGASAPSLSSSSSRKAKDPAPDEPKSKRIRLTMPSGSRAGVKAEDKKGLLDLIKERNENMGKTDQETSSASEVEEEEHEDAADAEISINVQCFQGNLNSNNPFAATNARGAQRVMFVRQSESFNQFVDTIADKVRSELVDDRKDWTIHLSASGKGHIFKTPTELDLRDKNVQSIYQTWLDVCGKGNQGTVKVVGTKRPAISKSAAMGKDEVAKSDLHERMSALGPEVRDAMLAIWKDNVCKGGTLCGEKSSLYPACWPVPGGERHLNLTVETTLVWATALAAEMEEEDLREAGLSGGQKVRLRAALKKWRLEKGIARPTEATKGSLDKENGGMGERDNNKRRAGRVSTAPPLTPTRISRAAASNSVSQL